MSYDLELSNDHHKGALAVRLYCSDRLLLMVLNLFFFLVWRETIIQLLKIKTGITLVLHNAA